MSDLQTAAQAAGLVKAGGIVGVEGLSAKHRVIPNIVLVHPTSAHFVDKGIAPGKIVSTLTGDVIQDTSFIAAYMTEKMFVYKYLDEKCETKELLFVCDDGDPRLFDHRTAREGNLKPEVIPTIIVAAIMGGKPVKIALRSASGYPAGQKLYTYIDDAATENGTPMWGNKYKLTAYKKPRKKGSPYYAFDVEKIGPASEQEQQMAMALHDAFKSKADVAVVEE